MKNNRCYTNPVKIKPTKLVLHSLGVAQPNAQVIINNMDAQTASTSVHAFIQDNQIIQTLPWNYKGWHVGSGSNGSWNGCSIGVEICEPSGHKYNGGAMVNYDIKKNEAYFTAVYNNAVELFAYLCQQYNLDPMKDIYCHCEVHKLGYGSNHSDVMQWFPKHGKSMDTFRADVKALMEKSNVPEKTITRKSSAKDINWLKERLNKLGGPYKLELDGIYDNKTRITVLWAWEKWGWNKDGQDTGWAAGVKTINKLK